jgi:hypothetical protein
MRGGMGGLLNATTPSADLVALLKDGASRYTWVGAAVGSNNASGYQLATELPVMAIGGHAVHIPYHLTWELERVDDHDEDVTELASIAELPAWLGLR